MVSARVKRFIKYFIYFFICTQVCFWILILTQSENISSLGKSWKFKNFNLQNWKDSQISELKNESNIYFRQVSSELECFIEGTNWNLTRTTECKCKNKYYGKDCGIPESVWHGHYSFVPDEVNKLVRRKYSRRIIQGILFNHEYDMLNIRLATSYDVVDAYLIQESNFSTIGEPKKLNLLNKLMNGWMKFYQNKIFYVPLLFFLNEWNFNGWLVEDYIRNHLSLQGLPLLQNTREDDLFLLFDADEIPNRDVLLFLKLYDGYSEPIQFHFRWNMYGYFWVKAHSLGKPQSLRIYVGCTLDMLEQVYNNEAVLIRRNALEKPDFQSKVLEYGKSHYLKAWCIGTSEYYAGFHCSWCFEPEGIRSKLLSAQKEDKPRWGDYPEKTNLSYIASLIRTGGWFDGSYPTIKVNKNDSYFAPDYVLGNRERFKYLLETQ